MKWIKSDENISVVLDVDLGAPRAHIGLVNFCHDLDITMEVIDPGAGQPRAKIKFTGSKKSIERLVSELGGE